MPTILGVPDSDLPSFARPPVIETVLGVQFDSLPNLKNAHLGAFWHRLGSDWPHVADEPRLDSQFERFDDEASWIGDGVRLRLTRDPASRLQIRNGIRDRMIQIQNGRFHLNWLKKPGEDYPRYSKIRTQFDRLFSKFEDYVQETGVGSITPNQWEVTYVNHFPAGTTWSDPNDWRSFLPSMGPEASLPTGLSLETFGGHWQFEIEPQLGRLHVEVQHGRSNDRPSSEDPVLVMKLTARGPMSTEVPSVGDGLDLGRKAIVLAFKGLTSEEAHEFWGPISHDNG